MRRVIMMLDVTETEAEQIVSALDTARAGPISDNGMGIREALEDTRASAPPESQGFTLAFRSRRSGALGGKTSAIAMTEVEAA